MTDAATASPDIFVRIKGGGMVIVPASQQCVATYVLLEQEDWFEKETAFVRRLLKPGMQVLDIGADYGVYTVSMARAIGPTGRLVAFEPNAGIAAYLRNTLDGNKLGHVLLRQTDLAAQPNTLAPSSVGTLDAELEACGLGDIDFIRLNSEPHAVDILAGATQPLAAQSPLVMFTARQGADINTALLRAWRDLGYDLYRLIGPDTLLVPLGPQGVPKDSFEINLFACKPDRAAALEAAGLLAPDTAEPQGVLPGSGLSFWRKQAFANGFDQIRTVSDPRLLQVLDLYAFWRDETRPPAQRYSALTGAISVLQGILDSDKGSTTANTALMVRLAFEHGQRERALDVLEPMIANQRAKLPETPFWPVAARFDSLRPGSDPGVWFAASLIEAFERLRAHSGYFAPPLPLDQLDWLSKSPFASAEMERRRILQAERQGDTKATAPRAAVTREGPDNLNFDLWGAI